MAAHVAGWLAYNPNIRVPGVMLICAAPGLLTLAVAPHHAVSTCSAQYPTIALPDTVAMPRS